MMRRFSRYLPAILLYFCSMLLPAFAIKDDDLVGWGVLIYGWPLCLKLFGCSWLANLFFIYTVIPYLHPINAWRRITLYTATAAFLFALSFLLVDKIPGEKTDVLTGVVTRKAGYWVWLCSMAALLIAAIHKNRKGSTPAQE